MKTFFLIPALLFATELCEAQETHLVKTLTVDDRHEGYALFSYKVPTDGFYTFSLDGGFKPKCASTIYYCEYQLQLCSKDKNYKQAELNVASQAQDGNVCHFNSNQKNNTVSGLFKKDEIVELRLMVLKSDVNGKPHHELNLTNNTLVTVLEMEPALSQN